MTLQKTFKHPLSRAFDLIYTAIIKTLGKKRLNIYGKIGNYIYCLLYLYLFIIYSKNKNKKTVYIILCTLKTKM